MGKQVTSLQFRTKLGGFGSDPYMRDSLKNRTWATPVFNKFLDVVFHKKLKSQTIWPIPLCR